MPSETQTDFSGGLNTRLPAHRIGANQVTELQNADLSFGDLRGEFGSNSGGEQSFFYEAGNVWISPTGFSGAATIIDWPYGDSSGASGDTPINSNTNYFSGSPLARIKSGVTLTIASGVKVTIYQKTQGIHGANSYVEYNDDLFIGRSPFEITATTTANSSTLTTGDDTYKIQVGDELVNNDATTYLNDNVFVTATGSTSVTLSETAVASGTDKSYTIQPIISKFLDGNTVNSFRVGVNKPTPSLGFSQLTGQTRTSSHSTAWYGTTDPIPFQYGLSAYDKTGVESTISDLTDSNIGAVGGASFLTQSNENDDPQKITIQNITRSSTSDTSYSDGRYALYRVGGTSAIIKRLDNLFLDSSLTITATKSNNDLTVTLASARDAFQYKVVWYVYNGGNYRYYNSNTGYIDPYDASPDGTEVYSQSGETEYLNPSGSSLAFTLNGEGATHNVDLLIYMKIPGEAIEREYVCKTVNFANTNITTGNDPTYVFDYLDFQRADALVDIQPIEEKVTPVKGLQGLTESSNLFYGFKDNRVYVSDYGNPNSWPESGFLDFDQNITGFGKLGSELVVFSEYGIYRVFGSDPSLLKKVQIPTTEGVKSGASKTITQFQNGLIFAGLNGICFYNGQSVSRVTQNILDTFSLPNATASNNCGGYYEDTYYLLGSSGTGYKLDFKRGALLSRTTMNASTLYFKGSDNILYADTGKIGDPTGTRSNFTVTTRKFSAGDINEEKVYYSVKLTGESFSGTVNVLVDGTQTDTFSVSSVTDLDRTFYVSSPRQGNGIQVQLSNCSGQINRIVVNYDSYASLTDALFDSVTVKYIGTPTVAVDIDGTNKITATALSEPTGAVGEAKLYFPAMSNGVVPHLRETNNESSGRVLSYQYSASPV